MTKPLQPALETLFRILDPQAALEELLPSITLQEWAQVEQAARQQGLTLLLYSRLERVNKFVPDTLIEKLHTETLQATARNIFMLHHAGIMLKGLRERGLDMIALKGLYLAEAVYPAIGLRTFDDLDLLLHRPDLPAALEVMQRLGYELSSWYDPADPNRDLKHLPPLMKDGAPIVELHWTILEEEEPFAIDVDGLWTRSQPAEIAGVNVLGLSVEDMLLHLSLHLTYQHRLAPGARNLYDIDGVIRRGGIDWQRLAISAREWGAQRVVWLTFRLLEEIAGTPLPNGFLAQLLPAQPDQAIVEDAKRQLLARGEGGVALTPDLAALGETKGISGKLRLALSRVFIPRRILAREYNVNPRSIRIYYFYLVRLVKLAREYGAMAWRLLRGGREEMASAQRERARANLNRWLAGDVEKKT